MLSLFCFITGFAFHMPIWWFVIGFLCGLLDEKCREEE